MLREFIDDTYIIINKSDISSVNFDEIKQDSVYTCRYSIDNKLVILSYFETPNFIKIGRLKPKKYLTWNQAVIEMQLPNWSETPKEDE
mgnify:CR=1 FL=1|jgi:hypothetical protein|tara:strand:- start:8385 stop:8648 length:264 start_codon:yes stop_codon:yes gene_type:complete